MFGDDTAGCHRLCFALQGDDSVHQHQRLIGEPDPGREAVSGGKSAPQHPGNRAAGKFKAEVTVEEALPDSYCG